MNHHRSILSPRLLASSCALALALTLACNVEDEPGEAAGSCDFMDANAPDPLRWRRYQVLLGELSRALFLPRSELCTELGTTPCAEVHQVALGGNNPFEQSMYEPIRSPLPLTPTVIDRVVLSACINRVNADLAGDPVVFTEFDLSADGATPDDPAVRAQTVALFERFHGRDPDDAEVDVIATLADGSTGKDFAILACFAIGSTTEMVFI